MRGHVNQVTLPRPRFDCPDYPRWVLSRTRVALTALTALAAVAAPGSTLLAPTAAEVSTTGGAPAERVERDSADDVVTSVLAISVDGLNPTALGRLGREGTPHLHAFMDAGAYTLNARTERELTITLPNHTGMVTGRRVEQATGGHGVTWNDDRRRPRTVQAAARRPVDSVFDVVHDAGGSTALFANKTKFSLWERSWGDSIDRTKISLDARRLVRATMRDLEGSERALRFLHIGLPDAAGHAKGFMSRPYMRAVRQVDVLVGELIDTVMSDPTLAGSVAVILTADHGGLGKSHSAKARLVNYRVPFMVRGPGVAPGADLYDLNPDYADPGTRRTSYDEDLQPVRNGALANLALDLLDLPAIPGSEHNAALDLDVNEVSAQRP